MVEEKRNKNGRFYTKHGQRKCLGKAFKANGVRALGYFNSENEIIGYATLEEIFEMFYSQELEDCKLSF